MKPGGFIASSRAIPASKFNSSIMPSSFVQRLSAIQREKGTRVCVGLDPDLERLPPHLLKKSASHTQAVRTFNEAIIEATREQACAFKLNFAFYEALGPAGWDVLKHTITTIPNDVLIIADAKRGDIGNSARFYAQAVFEQLGCDACTVSPYMGEDAVQPFLAYEDRSTFVLARTTNAGARALQECRCDGEPIYVRVARLVASWNETSPGTAGLVAGATDVNSLRTLRTKAPRLPFLIPGVGAQGGNPEAVIEAAATEEGTVLVNSSRSIIYASTEDDFAEAAAREAERLRRALGS